MYYAIVQYITKALAKNNSSYLRECNTTWRVVKQAATTGEAAS